MSEASPAERPADTRPADARPADARPRPRSRDPWPPMKPGLGAWWRDHVRIARETLRFVSVRLGTSLLVWLLVGIALALLAATASGVLLDGGRTIGIPMKVAGPPSGGLHEFLEELHESVSNLLILFVVLHAGYLIAFKRPLARFMLFRTEKRRPG